MDADPSSQGAGPNGATVDYSDATTRRMQQDTTTGGEMATRQIVDPTFMDLYQQKSQDFSNSLRKSYQPKEYKSLAEGDSEKQKQGLINSYMSGGPTGARAGQALTLDNGDPVYNNSGVNTVDGSGSSYSKSQENVNNAQASASIARQPTKAPNDTSAATPTNATAKNQAQAPSALYKMKIDQAKSQYGFTDADLPPLSSRVLPNGNVIVRSPSGDEVTISAPVFNTVIPALKTGKPVGLATGVNPTVADAYSTFAQILSQGKNSPNSFGQRAGNVQSSVKSNLAVSDANQPEHPTLAKILSQGENLPDLYQHHADELQPLIDANSMAQKYMVAASRSGDPKAIELYVNKAREAKAALIKKVEPMYQIYDQIMDYADRQAAETIGKNG